MFDSTYISNPVRTEYVTKQINITEHKAPTEESARLLMDLENAARDKFIGKYQLNDNTINLDVHTFKNVLRNRLEVAIRLTVNGKLLQHRFFIDKDYMSISKTDFEIKQYLWKTLQEKIAEMISIELLSSMNQQTAHNLFEY